MQGEFPERGGILLVAPPEHLKTTFVEILSNYPDALVVTDLVTRDLAKIRSSIADGRFVTLGLPEFQKLYYRDEAVASNIQGNIQALMEEGFAYVPGGSPDVKVAKARALVVAGCTRDLFERKSEQWQSSGFLRRLLVSRYRLRNPNLLAASIERWRRIEILGEYSWNLPNWASIPHSVSPEEARKIAEVCAWQNGKSDPAKLLHKILSVLRWRNRKWLKKKDDSFDVVLDFMESLAKEEAIVEFDDSEAEL